MRKLTGISGQEATKALRKSNKLIFRGISKKGHAIFQVIGLPYNISIPLHKEVSRFLLKDQIKLARITKKEFLKLLGRKN